jgi:hypothetical protein
MTMAAPEDQPAVRCFLSYAHGDEAELDFIDEFKSALSHYAYSDRGRRVEVFVDHDSIGWGDDWHQKIRDSVGEATVFIPLVTVQYLARPMCREELLLFFEGARELGVAELFLPVVVLGHRFISEDSDDPVAQRIAKRQYKDLRDAVLHGTDSSTWRIAMLDIANSLVDAVESAEENLARRQPAAPPQDSSRDERVELDENAPGLDELDDAATEGATEVGELIQQMVDGLNQVTEIVTPVGAELRATKDRRKTTAILLRLASDIRPLSEEIEQIGAHLESKTAEVDGLLRTAWSLVRDHGGESMTASFKDSIAQATSKLSDLDDAEESVAEFLESLKPAEVLSVGLRKAIRPMRKGVTAARSALSTMQSWPTLTST